jgi:hypothetical protein
MKSFLHQLENNEAILLMYLAEELPPQDRQEVEQMLASDENLRRELSSLRATQQKCFDGLAKLDEFSRPALPDEVAIRQTSRLLRRWHIERTLRPPAASAPGRGNLRWRTFGGVAAAVFLAGGFAWWVNHTDLYTPGPRVVTTQNDASSPSGDTNQPLQATNDSNGDAPMDGSHVLSRDEKLALLNGAIAVDDTPRSDQADRQLAALSEGQDLLSGFPDRGDLEQ